MFQQMQRYYFILNKHQHNYIFCIKNTSRNLYKDNGMYNAV